MLYHNEGRKTPENVKSGADCENDRPGLNELSSALDAMQRQASAAAQLFDAPSPEAREALRQAQRDMTTYSAACAVVVGMTRLYGKSIIELDGADLVRYCAER